MTIGAQIKRLKDELPSSVTLVAVSKMHPVDAIAEAYEAGQRIFGESRVQELKQKHDLLPQDIHWHMIGHLQTNKVKYIAPFVEMIHSVDSDKLLAVIDREAEKNARMIDVLLEVHVAAEETKSGWLPDELEIYIKNGKHLAYNHVRVRGLMTIASQTQDIETIRREFTTVKDLFMELKPYCSDMPFDTLSMGMTADYDIAVECGSTMVRIGSMIFGERL